MLDYDASKALYDLLDEVLGGHPVPPGATGLLYRVVDQLRASPIHEDQLATVEAISIQLHQLGAALFAKNARGAQLIRDELRVSATYLVQSHIYDAYRSDVEHASNLHPLSIFSASTPLSVNGHCEDRYFAK